MLNVLLSKIRYVAALLVALPLAAGADHHFDAAKVDEVGPREQKLAAEITAFLEEYARVYNDQDYRAVKAMWDEDSDPIYMAEEVPFPLYGWDRLTSYFNPVPGRQILDGIDNRYSEVRAKFVARDVAVATYRLDYDIKLVGRPAQAGWDRVLAVFKKRRGQWKLTAYAEAPMGPATMVRRMMKEHPPGTDKEKAIHALTKATITELAEAGVSEGFDEFLAERKDLKPVH